MADTFSKIHIQIVFAVQSRANLIHETRQEELNRYITGIVKGNKQKLLAVNGMPDHVHILIGLNPSMALSDLAREIKSNSSKHINEKGWVRGKFHLQEGYGAFSYGHSQIDAVYRYIMNQQQHHRKRTFREEYLELLRKFEVEYEARRLFEWIE